jgi:catechol 2,3-dioxygenase-like lactoylglutathione lyase family enzyme
MAEFPPPPEGIVLAHFIVADNVERSRRFYTEVLGGRVVFSGDVTYIALANSWIIINVGGGPTDDKPSVTLETPRDPDRLPQYPGQRHPRRVCRMERPGCSVPDAAETASVRDPLLHPRSRRSSDRSGANHGPGGGLVPCALATEYARRRFRVNAEVTANGPRIDGGQSSRH